MVRKCVYDLHYTRRMASIFCRGYHLLVLDLVYGKIIDSVNVKDVFVRFYELLIYTSEIKRLHVYVCWAL